MTKAIQVYTDGSCVDTTGGYGIVMFFKGRMKKFQSNSYKDTTNNRMELKAVIKALDKIDHGYYIDIYSDSRYCVSGANEWVWNWLKNGSLDSRPNSDLWKLLIGRIQEHKKGGSKVTFNWVRGHAGNNGNEIADTLANVSRAYGKSVVCKKRN